jgi:hypothetical protein
MNFDKMLYQPNRCLLKLNWYILGCYFLQGYFSK